MTRFNRDIFSLYLRNFVFGVEDSLVSTVGLLSGVAAAGSSSQTVVLTGVILIFVEAFSMAVGSFLSEHSVEEFKAHSEVPIGKSVTAGAVMFFSYFVSGFIPLFPYLIFELNLAFSISIALSLLSLFVLGIVSARIFGISLLRKGLELLVVGGIAIGVGVVIGRVVQLK